MKKPEIRSWGKAVLPKHEREARERRKFYRGFEGWSGGTGVLREKWRLATHPQLAGNIRVFRAAGGKWMTCNEVRDKLMAERCPYCDCKMVRGKEFRTESQKTALQRGYHGATDPSLDVYLHPNYATLDHKRPKSLYPELTFEVSNLHVVCTACNDRKGSEVLYEEVKAARDKSEQLRKELTEI
ncbi:hypothetical protein KR51_00006540 [Rubidibacter lacunae KORDI 51-2]|uniref:HNH domain-containing protein n=1 Tax=Rubidibacter lacunae KORDI 51-2 TaxID=582515 RepID=U5DP71_9CHRO|nr:HNH endonuclease [Rubidibacter lacunae]ERN42627.1 hypothetical protein KR51_00006540 [Rubidibacter lacunae KORDI 51-2]